MINMHEKYLPTKRSMNRILLKSLLGVFVGGLLFSTFFLVTDVVLDIFTQPKDSGYSVYEFFSLGQMYFTGITLWTLVFASVPTLIGGILLSGIIYQDFKLEIESKRRSIITGLLLAGAIGLSVSIVVAFTVFRQSDIVPALRFAIPATLIASSIGAWGGLQVHKEISSEFSVEDKVKESS